MLGRYIDLGNPVADHPLNAGLVNWWLGLPNNYAGYTAYDLLVADDNSLQIPNHGALSGGVTPAPAPVSGGLFGWRFNGTSGRIDVQGTSSNRFGSNNITVSAWINPLSTSTTNRPVISDGGNAFEAYINSTSKHWFAGVPGSLPVDSTNTVTVGKIKHLLYTSDSSPNVSLYTDGQLSISDNTQAAYLGVGATLQIGAETPITNTFFQGMIWNVAIWNRVLSASEVYQVYQEGLTGLPNLLRRWSRKTWLMGTGSTAVALTGSSTLSSITSSGSLLVGVPIAGASSLHSITSSGSLAVSVTLSGPSALKSLTSSGSLVVGTSISGSSSLQSLTSSGTLAVSVVLSGSSTLQSLTSSGTLVANVPITGTSTLGSLTSSGSLVVGVPITGSSTLGSITSSGSLVVGADLSGASTLSSITSDGTLAVGVSLSGGSGLSSLTSSGTLTVTPTPPVPPPPLPNLLFGGGAPYGGLHKLAVQIRLTGKSTLLPIQSSGSLAISAPKLKPMHPDESWLLSELTGIPVELLA